MGREVTQQAWTHEGWEKDMIWWVARGIPKGYVRGEGREAGGHMGRGFRVHDEHTGTVVSCV